MLKTISITTSVLLLTGCATMFKGTEQQLTVSTAGDKSQNSTRCHLANTYGSWNATPNTLTKIYRDSEPLKITCENEKQTGTTSVSSEYSSGLFALDLIGTGLIGVMVDGANKSLYEYPTPAAVTMIDAALKESK
ncbi:MAG: hypothetical protein WCL34_13050 [Methylococcaceae bacterium]